LYNTHRLYKGWSKLILARPRNKQGAKNIQETTYEGKTIGQKNVR